MEYAGSITTPGKSCAKERYLQLHLPEYIAVDINNEKGLAQV